MPKTCCFKSDIPNSCRGRDDIVVGSCDVEVDTGSSSRVVDQVTNVDNVVNFDPGNNKFDRWERGQ